MTRGTKSSSMAGVDDAAPSIACASAWPLCAARIDGTASRRMSRTATAARLPNTIAGA